MFAVAPRYQIEPAAEAALLQQITAEIGQALGLTISTWREVGDGQNLSYQLFVQAEEIPRFVLKIPIRSGYPSVATLRACYELLRDAGWGNNEIAYADESDAIMPYGFIVQPWLPGEALQWSSRFETDFRWVVDFLALLKQVHEITLPGFGYLAHGPQYPSIFDYFCHMDEVIDNSFGNGFGVDSSIWDLERMGVTSDGFLTATFRAIQEMAATIEADVKPVLVHGDMLPGNLLYTPQGPTLIDWDESRAGWWLYDVARTLYYCPYDGLLDYCLDHYPSSALSRHDIMIGIHLEHVRQALRELCIRTFHVTDLATAQTRVAPFEAKIQQLLSFRH